MCIRNNFDEFVKEQTHYYGGVPTSPEAETHGLLAVIKWIQLLQYQIVTIEFVCKAIVDGIGGIRNSVTEFGSIICVCTSLLSHLRNFKVVSFSYVS